MTYLQNNLGIFKIEGPHPLWPGELPRANFPGLGSRITGGWNETDEGHDGGSVLGQGHDRTGLYRMSQLTGLSWTISLPLYLGALRSRYVYNTKRVINGAEVGCIYCAKS
jgi:hypothetical protein